MPRNTSDPLYCHFPSVCDKLYGEKMRSSDDFLIEIQKMRPISELIQLKFDLSYVKVTYIWPTSWLQESDGQIFSFVQLHFHHCHHFKVQIYEAQNKNNHDTV